jgi:4-hydroxy-4-methyl-2-oxoglutarate aldolase
MASLQHVAESALLHEAMGRRGALDSDFRPLFPGARLLGRALTVRGRPGDNLMLHLAISVARPGDVIVATLDRHTEAGAWGEITTLAARMRGVAGLLTDGAVRDSEPIARAGFPVFSRGVCIKGTTKRLRGEINQPVVIGGILVNPGDFVVGDADGVVIVPAAEAEAVDAKARQIRAREAEIMRQLEAGALTLDLLGLRHVLEELGLDRSQ